MRFWDSSAIAPLLVEETASRPREAQLHEDAEILVWYGTWTELESAICRRERETSIGPEQAAMARTRLSVLTRAWLEVQPTSWVRERAIRLLRVHPLRAADAMQLARPWWHSKNARQAIDFSRRTCAWQKLRPLRGLQWSE